jgi:aminoglycoside/choline kinase family phosphotransferase
LLIEPAKLGGHSKRPNLVSPIFVLFNLLSMQHAQAVVTQLAETYLAEAGLLLKQIQLIPQSGSDRVYYRITTNLGSLIGTYNPNIKENAAFIQFTQHFNTKNLPVPTVLSQNAEGDAYLQTDVGNLSLMQVLEQNGYTQEVKALFSKSLAQLARLQVSGHQGINYDWCITAKEFGKHAIKADLFYFKYYFLDTLKTPYDKEALVDDFDAFAAYLTRTEYKFFMFRDFQSRNIMMENGEPYFIDYQGGMRGAPQYDAASLLWQARANLPEDWKQDLLEDYMNHLDALLLVKLDRNIFVSQYYGYVLIRMLQVLGAYGFRGLFERKAHFLASIPLALRNLKWFIENRPLGIILPEFVRMLKCCVSDEVLTQFTPPKANENTPLIVHISSFSYKKKGYPTDESDNGGGFVFDCRGILNPGRIDQYKPQTGKDKDVVDYLEQNTRMPTFLNSVWDLVDISVEEYLKRGFDRLMINFGCTGGQHRSVYAAEQTARHLRNKYNVKTEITHFNASNWPKPGSET